MIPVRGLGVWVKICNRMIRASGIRVLLEEGGVTVEKK